MTTARETFQETYAGGYYGDNLTMIQRFKNLAGKVYDALFDPTYPTIVAVTDNVTLDATNTGNVLRVTAAAKTITLPATAAGLRYTVVIGAASGTVGVTISPNASDKIMGTFFNGANKITLTGTDNKDLAITAAAALKGDRLTLVADGVDGWYIENAVGAWTEESQTAHGTLADTVVVTGNRALVAADSGKTFFAGTDATNVFSLPATVAGLRYKMVNIGTSGNNIMAVSPVAADGISGTFTLAASVVVDAGVVDKDIINTKASAKPGDYVELMGTGVTGSQAWIIVGSSGIWAVEG